jgi:hypothetical protein
VVTPSQCLLRENFTIDKAKDGRNFSVEAQYTAALYFGSSPNSQFPVRGGGHPDGALYEHELWGAESLSADVISCD